MTHRPWTNRKIGIEMEMNRQTTTGTSLSQDTIFRSIGSLALSHPVRNVGYGHSNGSAWEVKTDGSCGSEVVSPAIMLDDEGDNSDLRDVCTALNRLSPAINRSCGLHVHVEVRDFNWDDLRRLMALWTRYEPFFFEMLPPSRRNNSYCQPLRKSSWTGNTNVATWANVSRGLNATTELEFHSACRGTFIRYHSLNLDNFWMHGRIEFRLHSGTIDYVKIRNWAKLLLALVARVKIADAPRISPMTGNDRAEGFNTYYVCKVLGLIRSKFVADVPDSNRSLVDWIEARRRLFDGTLPRGGRRGRAVASPEANEL